ncbi:MAG TPA: hypothetical protein VFZ65_03545 [Planctomycetota bacterium]|nr:hypothetical protein [Planctomycetota bacterium]
MESVNEIKEALSARSRTATLDELRDEGRRRVRLIRAEHIASMISEAVHTAIEQSGLIAPEEANRLVEKSRQEFKTILKEREQEVQRSHEVEEMLAEREQELAELKSTLDATSRALAETKAALEEMRAEGGAQPGMRAAAVGSNDLLMSMMQEMATLKANLMHQQSQAAPAPVQPAAAAAAAPDFSAAFEKLAGTLNDRLEKLGKKMGVSSAVESDAPLDFGGLFRDSDKSLESNMDNIQVKQKAGGGIAANLARLKKLKGGGG